MLNSRRITFRMLTVFTVTIHTYGSSLNHYRKCCQHLKRYAASHHKHFLINSLNPEVIRIPATVPHLFVSVLCNMKSPFDKAIANLTEMVVVRIDQGFGIGPSNRGSH